MGDLMRDLEFGWFLPTRGDTLDYTEPQQVPPSPEMFRRVVQTAENNGFEYILLPVSALCWDAWITSAMLIGCTKSIRMLVAARPSYINPGLLAKMIATYDQMSEGRISINLIAGHHYPRPDRQEAPDEPISSLIATLMPQGRSKTSV